MKVDYKFSNLCGTVYRKGNIIFSRNGDCLFSPVGNRVTCFDLKNNKSFTLPFESQCNISKLCLSPNNGLLIVVDENNKCILFSLKTNTKLDHFSFKKKVHDIKFSPNGRYIVVTFGRGIQIWHAPGTTRQFAPLTLVRTSVGAYDDTTCIDWSTDSRFVIVGGKDMSSRIYSIHKMKQFKPWVLSGHRNSIVNNFFLNGSLDCMTLSKDGALYCWNSERKLQDFELEDAKRKHTEEDEETNNEKDDDTIAQWSLNKKHYFNQDQVKLTSCEYHKTLKILVVGFSSGIFLLYEMPDFINIHSLSITQHRINSIAINPNGDWLAFASSTLGQLLVWEWQSETYVLKQQGHFYDMNVMAYSPDGQYIVTGGDDGKVKIWNTISGFCFVTFHEHSGGVTGVSFSQNGQVVVSASLDGTVRAFDMNRYRNFRTFTAPKPCQFSCLALDTSGEIICAGSLDTFEIFMWSMQTGRLLEVMAGHEGPLSCLAFSPIQSILVSGSWDNTVRLWDVYTQSSPKETVEVASNVTAVAYRPDGHEVAISALDGEIKFWQPESSLQIGSIEGRKDLGTGRKKTDLITSKSLSASRCFTTLCYSADGQCLLAGGRSRYVCIYHIQQQILLRRFEISCNKSLDGMQRYLNSKNMSESGPLDLIDVDMDSDDENGTQNISLPGVKKGRAWAAATTEGLLIYSFDRILSFRPEDLDVDVTPARILELIKEEKYPLALSYAFRLNEDEFITRSVECIPINDIETIVRNMSLDHVERLMNFIGKQMETSAHLQYYLTWTKHILSIHGAYIKSNSRSLMPVLRMFQKSLVRHSNSVSSLCEENKYALTYLLHARKNEKNNEFLDDNRIDENDVMVT